MTTSHRRSLLTHGEVCLQLHYHHFRLADNRFQRCDILPSHFEIRPGHHDNPVLSFSVHHDGSHTCSLCLTLPDILRMDPLLPHDLKQLTAKSILAHSADHRHLCAKTGCGCSLIRPFSAWR
ncbi:hypothetical protein D3C80_1014620 [compost metagenome]